MIDRQVAEPRSADRPFDDLPLKPGFRFQLTGVEKLGGKIADGRVQPPSLRQEQPAIRWDGLFTAENVSERRNIGAFRVAALRGLV